jgi:Fur family iron response transcriptional regulator
MTTLRKPSPAAQKQESPDAEAGAVQRLRMAGLRTTRQRLTLAEILFADGLDRHVTAESLYARATELGTKLSLATVYNCLHQFTNAGLLRIVTVDSGRAYFDTNLSPHHHFYYEKSGELRDIPATDVALSSLPEAPEGRRISRVDVIVRLDG